jgi:flagellar M-ring protein FliF
MPGKNQLATTKRPADVGQVMERVKLYWAGLPQKQRIYLGVGLGVVLAVALFFVKMMATPDYKPLMTGLEPADAQTLSAQLAAKKIPYVVSPDGTSVSVPKDKLDEARLEVASQGTTHSGRIGYEIFDKVSWGQTEFDEKVNYQRALEGELERTIQTIGNVKSARVHLVMASNSVFLDRERGAKASVTLKLKRGSLTREELSSIARLVSGAVDELKPQDVAIIDADSNLSLGESSNTAGGGDHVDQELTRRLMATLAPIVGSDRVRATVNVEYETGSSEESDEKYDPAVSATLTMQHSEQGSGAGLSASGVPGTSSNVPKAKKAAAKAETKDAGQFSRTDNNTYGVNKTTRHVIEPAGGIRRLTAAVVLDDAVDRQQQNGKWVEIRHKRQPDELRMIGEIAQAAIGFSSDRGDVISVQNLTFDRPQAENMTPPSFLDNARKGLNDYSSVVRYSALFVLFFLVYMLMIRPIQKRVLATPVPAMAKAISPHPAEQHANEAAAGSATNLLQHSIVLKKQLAEFVKAEPESSTTAVRAWLREDAS